jgi:hypothetical protein
MSDRDTIIKEIDGIIDTYQSGISSLPDLLVLRRNLAIYSYSLASHIKQTYGKAALGYAKRKYEIAAHIVSARNIDAKAPLGFLEQSALKTPAVMEAQEKEIWAEAEKEELQGRLRTINNVLASMQQEAADMRVEKSNPSYSEQH